MRKKWYAPIDVKIVAWFFIVVGIFGLLSVMLLITGIAQLTSDNPRKVFFGTFNLVSDISNIIYFLLIGMINLITGYILKKGSKIGWWLAFAASINGISDSILLGFTKHGIITTTTILVDLTIIIWLLYRRQIYNIGPRKKIKA